jgi:uncharacterized protein YeaO (DUF488 family)
MTAGKLQIKRVYLPPEDGDGHRVLVDRLWPRGLTKDRAALELWSRDAAPSADVRREYCHDPEKFPAFQTAYRAELEKNDAAADLAEKCRTWLESGNVTLLYAAKDGEASNAAVLKKWIETQINDEEREN